MTMNAYITEFFANCPNNGVRIKYALRIETNDILPVEQIIVVVESIDDRFHEEIADGLHQAFGGIQTLVADHHGVTIETTRGSDAPSNKHIDPKYGVTPSFCFMPEQCCGNTACPQRYSCTE
jgi:hypothetical protein